jgi:hypothetical protein
MHSKVAPFLGDAPLPKCPYDSVKNDSLFWYH